MNFLGGSNASKESSDGGEDRGKDSVAEASDERGKGSNQARDDSANNANDKSEDLGEDGEDGVEDGDELRLEADGSDESLDGGEDVGDEDDDKAEDSVDMDVGNVEAGDTGQLSDDLGELQVDSLELGNDQGDSSVLGERADLDLLNDLVCDVLVWSFSYGRWMSHTDAGGLAVDLVNSCLDSGDQDLRVGDGTLDRNLIDNLLDANLLGDNVGGGLDKTVDLSNSAVDLRNRAGNGRDGQSKDGEESSLHCEIKRVKRVWLFKKSVGGKRV